MHSTDQTWMSLALEQAKLALQRDEVPVGAVVVRDGVLLGAGYNQRQGQLDPTAHAEILALREAARRVGDWRLPGAALYVTLEPCPMCAGAILASRIERLIFGAQSPQAGSAGSVLNLVDYPGLFHQTLIESGVGVEESQALLDIFFQRRRGLAHGEVAEPG